MKNVQVSAIFNIGEALDHRIAEIKKKRYEYLFAIGRSSAAEKPGRLDGILIATGNQRRRNGD